MRQRSPVCSRSLYGSRHQELWHLKRGSINFTCDPGIADGPPDEWAGKACGQALADRCCGSRPDGTHAAATRRRTDKPLPRSALRGAVTSKLQRRGRDRGAPSKGRLVPLRRALSSMVKLQPRTVAPCTGQHRQATATGSRAVPCLRTPDKLLLMGAARSSYSLVLQRKALSNPVKPPLRAVAQCTEQRSRDTASRDSTLQGQGRPRQCANRSLRSPHVEPQADRAYSIQRAVTRKSCWQPGHMCWRKRLEASLSLEKARPSPRER